MVKGEKLDRAELLDTSEIGIIPKTMLITYFNNPQSLSKWAQQLLQMLY